jgi:NAD-dependent SIR2 family protein deacetylase
MSGFYCEECGEYFDYEEMDGEIWDMYEIEVCQHCGESYDHSEHEGYDGLSDWERSMR